MSATGVEKPQTLGDPGKPAEAPVAPTPKRRRWLRRLLVLGVVVVALYLARAPILRGVGHLVVAGEDGQTGQFVLIYQTHHAYDAAAQLLKEDASRQVFLIRLSQGRLVRLGIVAPDDEVARHELAQRGISKDRLSVRIGAGHGDWDRVRLLGDWLGEHPGAEVTVLCDEFGSRRLRLIIDRTLAADAGRVHLKPVPDPRFDTSNWWHNKDGVVDVFESHVSLAYTWLNGDDSGAWQEADLDAAP